MVAPPFRPGDNETVLCVAGCGGKKSLHAREWMATLPQQTSILMVWLRRIHCIDASAQLGRGGLNFRSYLDAVGLAGAEYLKDEVIGLGLG